MPELSGEQVVPPTALSGESLVLSRLERITNRAEQHPEEAFNNLFTLLNVELLRMAFDRLERNKAPGVDGRTVADYEANLESNLQDLEQRLHRGTYRPLPSLRRDIPKGNGKTRPRGIAAVEDNLVQRAVVMAMFDFLGFTHYCGQSRAGKFKLKRRTSKKKLRAKLRDMKD